jgi:hypothetical protein
VSAPEPLDVRVARALGCDPGYYDGWLCSCPNAEHGGDGENEARWSLHDYVGDAALTLRVVEENAADVQFTFLPKYWRVRTTGPRVEGWGGTIAEAVWEWVVAAKAAGMEVRGL